MFCELDQENTLVGFMEASKENAPTRAQIDRLQASMQDMPQATLDTSNYFSEGMYCRKVSRSKGVLIVGKVHKKEHFFICAAGVIIAWTDQGMKTLRAGDVLECLPGTKRVTLAVTDAIGITVHKTNKKNLDEIEAELMEPDVTALFDARNQLKSLTIKGEKS